MVSELYSEKSHSKYMLIASIPNWKAKHYQQRHNAYNGEEKTDIRQVLADFILNVRVPDDWYTILISLVAVYVTWKVLRFSIGLVVAVVRPFFVLFLLMVGIRERIIDLTSNNFTEYSISHVSFTGAGVIRAEF